MDGDAEILVDEPTGLEYKHDRTTELEGHTAKARELSRKDAETVKDSGVEELQHSCPGPKIRARAGELDVS